MPIPVSLTANRSVTTRSSRRTTRTEISTPPRSVNLIALPGKVEQHLLQPDSITDVVSGQIRRKIEREGQALLGGAGAQ